MAEWHRIITSPYTGSMSMTGSFNVDGDATITGNVTINGTASVENLVVKQIGYSSGSNQLGDAINDVQSLYGTVRIPTGSLVVNGNMNFSGSRTIQPLTASLNTKGPTLTILGGLAGATSGNGGDLILKGGNGINAGNAGGDVYIQGGDRTGAQRSGNIVIGVTSNDYQTYLQGAPIFNWDGPATANAATFQRNGSTRFILFDDVLSNSDYYFKGGANTVNAVWNNWNSVIVRGKGTTSSTTAFQVQNSNASASLVVADNGAVAIGQSTPYYYAFENSLTVNKTVYVANEGSAIIPALYIGSGGGGAGRGFYGVSQGIAVSTNNGTSMYFRGSPTLGSTDYPRIGINIDPTSVLDIRSDYTSSNLLNISSSLGTVMFISGSGNVGIGTNTPSFKLDVSGNTRILQSSIYMDSSGDPTIFGRNAAGTEQSRIMVRSQSHGGMELGTRTGYLSFQAGPGAYTERMRITNSGLIGIGTTAPSASLHVVGNTILSGSAGTGSALQVYKSGSTVVDVQGSSGQLFSITDSLSGSLFSVNTAAGLPTIEAFSDNTVNIGKFGSYPIKVVSLGTSAVVSGSFSGSGANLSGIPASAIVGLNLSQIATGSVSASVGLETGSFQITSGSSNFFFVSSSGNVGIGTTTPTQKLHVNSGNAFINGTIYFGNSSHYLTTDDSSYAMLSSNRTLQLATNGIPVLSVFNTQNIAIGSTTDSAKLFIKGSGTTSSTTALLVQNSAGSTNAQIYDDGQWFIGTGNIRVTGQPGNFHFNTAAGNVANIGHWGINFIPLGYSGISLTLDNSIRLSGPTFVTGSLTVTGSLAVLGSTILRGNTSSTGSLSITGSAGSGSALTVYKSGSTVVDIQGSQGSLMSVEDSLTGSLMSVGNISGLPLMEVFDDGTMNAGKFNVYPIKIVATGSQAVITGSFTGSFAGSINASAFTASSALVTGNVTVLGTASINNLVVNQIGYSSGSNQLGDAANDTQTLYGTVVIPTGSLTVSGSSYFSGSVGIGTAAPAYSLDVNGSLRVNNTLFFNTSSPTAYITWNGSALELSPFSSIGTIDLSVSNGRSVRIIGSVTNVSTTTFQIPFTYTNSSGTGTATFININPTINNTGTYSGTVRGLYYNPTLTSLTGTTHRAIETTAGDVVLNGGRVNISGSAGSGSALNVYKSGSTVFRVEGSQGELFAVTDSLSGSLFSVSNVSGLPILEVFSDNTVLLGSYLDPMLITTQRLTANSGSTVIYSLPTASYDGVFVDYVIRSGSNARAGQFMGLWSGSSANFTDSSTTDFGDTTGFVFGLVVSGSNMVLTGSASTSTWTVRAGIRSI